MNNRDLDALFEDAIERGKNHVPEPEINSGAEKPGEDNGEEPVVQDKRSNIQKLFDLACDNASGKVFNICDWNGSDRLLQGFLLETSEDQFDANGKRYWPSIEVSVNPNSKEETFKVTLESEEADPKIAENVSLSDTAEMVAFYIGVNQP